MVSHFGDAGMPLAAWPQTQPALPTLGADQVVQRLMEKNKERADNLQHYTATRNYRLEYRGFPTSTEATMEVEVNFDAPASKRFTVVSATGSKLIQNRVFHRLLESEEQAGDSSNRKSTELGPENYTFTLAGTEGTNYVLNVEPKADSRFLYKGTSNSRWSGKADRLGRAEAAPGSLRRSVPQLSF